ncbi:Uncharacterised protein [Staphylococcus saprophyticus]|nr:Uncharacterised protein [Staphylococcus saprophyticus]
MNHINPPPIMKSRIPNGIVDFFTTVPVSGKEKSPLLSNKPLKKLPEESPRDKARPGEGLDISLIPSNILFLLNKSSNRLGVPSNFEFPT